MTRAGLPVLKIALTLGVSPQAVYWHINSLRREGLLPSDAA
jgi:predicted transcriptional regulator